MGACSEHSGDRPSLYPPALAQMHVQSAGGATGREQAQQALHLAELNAQLEQAVARWHAAYATFGGGG